MGRPAWLTLNAPDAFKPNSSISSATHCWRSVRSAKSRWSQKPRTCSSISWPLLGTGVSTRDQQQTPWFAGVGDVQLHGLPGRMVGQLKAQAPGGLLWHWVLHDSHASRSDQLPVAEAHQGHDLSCVPGSASLIPPGSCTKGGARGLWPAAPSTILVGYRVPGLGRRLDADVSPTDGVVVDVPSGEADHAVTTDRPHSLAVADDVPDPRGVLR